MAAGRADLEGENVLALILTAWQMSWWVEILARDLNKWEWCAMPRMQGPMEASKGAQRAAAGKTALAAREFQATLPATSHISSPRSFNL
jgi:hypothetical protein